jgi:nucleotide-binding universal stress UspA family protein
MKKILIALDYNPTAQKVAEAGHALARAMEAEVILIHVTTDPVYYSATAYSPIMGFGGFADVDYLQPDFIDELKKAAQDFLNQSKRHLGDETIQTELREGAVAEAILEAAKDLKVDIIVVGTHSQRWLESIVMGSVSETILHHTLVPLYVIPTKNQG